MLETAMRQFMGPRVSPYEVRRPWADQFLPAKVLEWVGPRIHSYLLRHAPTPN